MEIMRSSTCGESMKRAWRRRKYQRLHGNKRKLKITRPGNTQTSNQKMKTIPRLSLKMVSPIKLLTKFHDAYVEMTMRLVNNMGKANNGGVFRGKKIAHDRHVVSMVSGGDEVDSRLVLEIYRRFAASGL
ncbi:hypothetical protein CRYUN_Cryun29cG0036600 [Craigia yunnanensis]